MTQTNNPRQSQGALRSDQSQLMFEEGFSFSGYERDGVFLNLCEQKFLDISGISGLDSITDGRAAVFADFDNDGDQDVFLTTIQGQVHLLFRNNVGQENRFLRVELEGDAETGLDAYGSVVRVKTSAGTITKIKSGGAGFISQHDPRLLFGLREDTRIEEIQVTWPDGKVERFEADVPADSSLRLRRGTGRAETVALGQAQLPDPLTRVESMALGLRIAVGKPMPDLAVETLRGVSTTLRDETKPGRRTVINFWATWCAPCRREMPELEKLRPHLSAQGIDVIGLNVDTDPNAKIGDFLAMTGVQYPNYVGGIPVIEQVYATDELTVPLSVIVDEEGIVTDLLPGWSRVSRRRFLELAGVEPADSREPAKLME